jgi:TM2 domain-containing membrane protein YozV
LYAHGEYEDALSEYLKIIPDDTGHESKTGIWSRVVDCAIKSQSDTTATAYIDSLLTISDTAINHCRLLENKSLIFFKAHQYSLALVALAKVDCREETYRKHLLTTACLCLNNQWQQAGKYAAAFTPVLASDSIAKDITMSWITMKDSLSYKSPLKAACISAVIPGAGKWYVGEYRDGIMALIFCGACAYQAYDGFSRHGTSSAKGWIFSSLGTLFYSGTIYGSAYAVKMYNKKLDNHIFEKIEFTINGQM